MSDGVGLTPKQRRAAAVLANAGTNAEAAAKARVAERTVERWRQQPEFVEHLAQISKEVADAILTEGLASRVNRVRKLAEMAERIEGVVQARASDERYKEPGYEQGIMVRDVKFSPDGDPHNVFSVDTGTSREYRETLKQIAQEVGQWAEKREVTGAGGRPLTIVEIPSDPERAAGVLAVLAEVGVIPLGDGSQ